MAPIRKLPGPMLTISIPIEFNSAWSGVVNEEANEMTKQQNMTMFLFIDDDCYGFNKLIARGKGLVGSYENGLIDAGLFVCVFPRTW